MDTTRVPLSSTPSCKTHNKASSPVIFQIQGSLKAILIDWPVISLSLLEGRLRGELITLHVSIVHSLLCVFLNVASK